MPVSRYVIPRIGRQSGPPVTPPVVRPLGGPVKPQPFNREQATIDLMRKWSKGPVNITYGGSQPPTPVIATGPTFEMGPSGYLRVVGAPAITPTVPPTYPAAPGQGVLPASNNGPVPVNTKAPTYELGASGYPTIVGAPRNTYATPPTYPAAASALPGVTYVGPPPPGANPEPSDEMVSLWGGAFGPQPGALVAAFNPRPEQVNLWGGAFGPQPGVGQRTQPRYSEPWMNLAAAYAIAHGGKPEDMINRVEQVYMRGQVNGGEGNLRPTKYGEQGLANAIADDKWAEAFTRFTGHPPGDVEWKEHAYAVAYGSRDPLEGHGEALQWLKGQADQAWDEMVALAKQQAQENQNNSDADNNREADNNDVYYNEGWGYGGGR